MVFDEALVVPDPEKSLEQGAVLPWRRGGKRMVVYYKAMLRGGCRDTTSRAWKRPTKTCRRISRSVLLHGSGETEVAFTFWRAGKMSKVSPAVRRA